MVTKLYTQMYIIIFKIASCSFEVLIKDTLIGVTNEALLFTRLMTSAF